MTQPGRWIGAGIVACIAAAAAGAPLLAPQDPYASSVEMLALPSGAHWFGTDELGRDILSRTLYGARISLIVAVSVVGLSLTIGLVAGCVAGFYGGWIDTAITTYVMNAFLALPGILLAIAFVAFMGPSGSGKTTLLNLLGGLDVPTRGSITVAGDEVTSMSASSLTQWRARHVGFIFQMYNLIPVLNAFQNVELPLLLTKLSKSERRAHVETALSVVGLADRMNHFPRQLSGGYVGVLIVTT